LYKIFNDKLFYYFSAFFIVFSQINAISQIDSLEFKNGNIIDGEIKSLERGIVVVSTDYSDSDFKIEWDQIHKIKTESFFFITLSDGRKYYGQLQSVSIDRILLVTEDNQRIEARHIDIVYLLPLEKTFWDRLSASIDVGFSLTKAQNLRQFNTRSSIGYKEKKWSTDASFNSIYSTQDSIEATARNEGMMSFRYILPRRWYPIASVSFLTNTEQRLDLRMNVQIGMGKFIIRTNSSYWGAKLGVNRNVERYSNETPDRESWEAYVGSELDLYNIGDLNLLTSLMIYPGITARERYRSDFVFDLKYDLPYDFYIKLGLSANYDNRPAEDASELDYVFQTGFGWEW
jgi:hypothetical protein